MTAFREGLDHGDGRCHFDDTVRVTEYADVAEVSRSPSFGWHPSWEPTDGFTRGVLFRLDDYSLHVARRRVLSKLMRPDALEWHREAVLLPLLKQTFDRLRAERCAREVCRGDLVALLRRVFVSFAGALIGCDYALTPTGAAELFDIIERNRHGYALARRAAAGAVVDDEDVERTVAAAVVARQEFETRFFDPAAAAAAERQARAQHGSRESGATPPNLISLIAAGAHPDYKDKTIAVNECLMLMQGAVRTSASLVVYEVDHLIDWLADHPEDRGRLEDTSFLLAVSEETLRLHGPFDTFHVLRERT